MTVNRLFIIYVDAVAWYTGYISWQKLLRENRCNSVLWWQGSWLGLTWSGIMGACRAAYSYCLDWRQVNSLLVPTYMLVAQNSTASPMSKRLHRLLKQWQHTSNAWAVRDIAHLNWDTGLKIYIFILGIIFHELWYIHNVKLFKNLYLTFKWLFCWECINIKCIHIMGRCYSYCLSIYWHTSVPYICRVMFR